MHALDTARQLAKDIKNTEEYLEYQACRERIAEEPGIMALVNEYKKLQMTVQMGAATGHPAPAEENDRFRQITTLLFSDDRTRDYLMAEMRLQQMMVEIFTMLTEATGIDLGLPT